MSLLLVIALIPWALTPLVLAAGLCIRHATRHPYGRIDRVLTRLFP